MFKGLTAYLIHHPTPPQWRAMPTLIGDTIDMAGHARPTPIRRNRFPQPGRVRNAYLFRGVDAGRYAVRTLLAIG